MIVVRTEVWSVPSGKIAKAVLRDELGRFIGATNQTKPVVLDKVVGR